MPGTTILKFINSLKQKKFRHQHQLFVVEGEKMVDELIESRFSIHSLYGTEKWIRERGLTAGEVSVKPGAETTRDKRYTTTVNKKSLSARPEKPISSTGIVNESIKPAGGEDNVNKCFSLHKVKDRELERVSSLKKASQVLAIARIPSFRLDKEELSNSLTLVLDKVRDPGNLGTLVRSADWFGVSTIILSEDSAEITNPKVVQSTMGSIFRIRYHYLDLTAFLKSVNPEGLPVIGAFLDGAGIYSAQLPGYGLLVLGNESTGISPEVERLVTQRITIPSHKTGSRAESLNIAVAGSIILSEFMRRG